jgi:hypothetical protein
VADDVRFWYVKALEEADQIAYYLGDAVLLHGTRFVGVAEAPEVGSDRPVTGFGQGSHLVAPEFMGVGPAMEKQDGRPLPDVSDVDADAVHLDSRAVFRSRPSGATCGRGRATGQIRDGVRGVTVVDGGEEFGPARARGGVAGRA